ncbi:unnamed protein product [Arabidopsis thaliana]|uniref:Uncharacterized protein n=1 Tax=Arabidopsis thaliana TaxID=3702 RepID=A0A654GAA5_ARATH|nr:unnamed protein product [Arabidopsis thaliana]
MTDLDTGGFVDEESDGSQASAQSSSSQAVSHSDEAMSRPSGVKAAKAAKAKRTLSVIKSMWEIKQKEFELNEKLSKKTLLETLLRKTAPLSDLEMALKNKLITDILSNA